VIRNLDHIAIVVGDLQEAIERFSADLGLNLTGTEEVDSQQTKTAFFTVSDPTRPPTIELVTPLRGEGPLVRHLDRRGQGLHHLCFRSDDLDADVAKLRAKGYRFTSEEPTSGAHESRVIFIHPKSTGGVLIELAEYPHG